MNSMLTGDTGEGKLLKQNQKCRSIATIGMHHVIEYHGNERVRSITFPLDCQTRTESMASLNKLAIRGIRSFDDKHVQVIEFYSPLTVIVGHNGSGKTTIIECLKYATTGDMPPNTKGGAFIHDPKMANEKEVKAQVRLRFWNVNHERMTATRNVQVTVKKGGSLTLKTLEGLLARADSVAGDKRTTISTKCAEMDEEVPLLMGVSKSILDNVIFCHQEDSNWPLSEPAALKKKFDDIFEATKYTKALDNIKVIRKERTAELKVDKERLESLKVDKDRSEKLKKDIEEQKALEDQKRTSSERLQASIETLTKANADFYSNHTRFDKIFNDVKTLEVEQDLLNKSMDRIKGNVTVMKEPDEELRDMLSNFSRHLAQIEDRKKANIGQREKEETDMETITHRQRSLFTKQGELNGERKLFESNVREREALVKRLASANQIAGYDYSPLEDEKILEFRDKLFEAHRKVQSHASNIDSDGRRREQELQAEVTRLTGDQRAAVSKKQGKQEQIIVLQNRIRTAESSFESISSLDADVSILEREIEDNKNQIKRLEDEIAAANYDEQISKRDSSARDADRERDTLNAELTTLNRQADTRAQLSIKRADVQAKTNSISASVEGHSQRHQELVGAAAKAETMEQTVGTAFGRKERDLQDAESSLSTAKSTLQQLQYKLSSDRQSIQSKKEELSKLERAIADVLKEGSFGTTDLNEAITEAQTELDGIKNEIASAAQMKELWQKILQIGNKDHKCLGCNRGIGAGNEKASFETYVRARLAKCSSAGLVELRSDEAAWSKTLEKLLRLAPTTATIKNLKEKALPDLDKQIQKLTTEVDAANSAVDDAQDNLNKAKTAVRDLQALRAAAAMISRSLSEVKDLKSEIAALERDLSGSGSLKTVDDVQQELNKVTDEIKRLDRERQTLRSERELKEKSKRTVADALNKKTLRMSDLQLKQRRRQDAEAAVAEHRENVAAMQAEMQALDKLATATVAPLREAQETLKSHVVEWKLEVEQANRQANSLQSQLSELDAKHRDTQKYITAGGDRLLRENEAKMQDVRLELTAAKESIASIDAKITKLQEEISKAQSTKTNIADNIELRRNEKRIKEIAEEIEKCDLDEAALAREQFNEKYARSMRAENKQKAELQMLTGELLQIAESRKRMEKTLKDDYHKVDIAFQEQLIKFKTGEVANNDLQKYAKALDNAIMAYHSLKMDEINDIIGHLWNKTYQGTDIDNIRIRSDHDETSNAARKSYNYRVVMVKNNVELDMRGRCSAGQKVLASIIIRLALAESFGQGCGVMALDEPTTNLDQENINALAEALAEIIRERRGQSGFQLIVITHDEGFLQRLAGHDVLEYYWRVSRDAQQKSILERQRITA